MAVLAAPPCSADIGQDPASCVTEFGTGTTENWSNGVCVDGKIGVVAGFEWAPSVNIPFISGKPWQNGTDDGMGDPEERSA